jgi:hypothetical protein
METLKALRSADDAEGWCFSDFSGLQRIQRFEGNAQRLAVGQGVSSHLDQAGQVIQSLGRYQSSRITTITTLR